MGRRLGSLNKNKLTPEELKARRQQRDREYRRKLRADPERLQRLKEYQKQYQKKYYSDPINLEARKEISRRFELRRRDNPSKVAVRNLQARMRFRQKYATDAAFREKRSAMAREYKLAHPGRVKTLLANRSSHIFVNESHRRK